MDEMYSAMPGSPITYLTSDISAGQTTIAIGDDSTIPDAPNLATIGYGEHIETIRYGAKSNGVLQEVTRGIEGTPRAWPSGTEVARFFTAYELNRIVGNITLLDNSVGDIEELETDEKGNLVESINELDGAVKTHLPVVLFSGNVSTANTIINLSESLASFRRLDVVINASGWETKPIYPESFTHFDIKTLNLDNSGTALPLIVYECRIERQSNTTLKILFNHRWSWNGNSTSKAAITTNGEVEIWKIYGIR